MVEPGGRRILLDTGNAPWNGTTDFGDSVLELTFPGLRLRQSYTPINQAQLNSSDTDLGSSAPALLGDNRVVLAGKDGIMRVLALSRLNGHPPSTHHTTLGGEVQQLSIPGGGELFTAPAVWHHAGHTRVFLAGFEGTGAYALRDGRLRVLWSNHNPGTSPILVGGLLYVYDPEAGGINIYDPGSSHPLLKLPGTPGTGTARSSSTATSSSPRATPTPTTNGYARPLSRPRVPAPRSLSFIFMKIGR